MNSSRWHRVGAKLRAVWTVWMERWCSGLKRSTCVPVRPRPLHHRSTTVPTSPARLLGQEHLRGAVGVGSGHDNDQVARWAQGHREGDRDDDTNQEMVARLLFPSLGTLKPFAKATRPQPWLWI